MLKERDFSIRKRFNKKEERKNTSAQISTALESNANPTASVRRDKEITTRGGCLAPSEPLSAQPR